MNWRRLLGRPEHEPDENDPAIEEAQERLAALERHADRVTRRMREDPWGTPLARIARRER